MKKRSTLLLSGAVFVTALTPSLAFSQEQRTCTPKEIAAGEKNCRPADASRGDTIVLDQITLLGNRAPVDVLKYPGSVSVVDMAKDRSHSTAIQALNSVPGFETGGDSGREAGEQYTIRGFGYQSEQRVIIKVDGVERSPSLFSNHVSSFRTDPTIVRRAEVAKGGASMLHGSGAIGGVVAMQTVDAFDFLEGNQRQSITARARHESNNQQSAALTFAYAPENTPVDFLLHGRMVKAGNIKLADGGVDGLSEVDNESKTYNLFAKAGVNLGPDQRLVFSAQSYKHDLTTVWQTLYHSTISDDIPIIGSMVQREAVAQYTWKPADNPLIDLEAQLYRSNGYYDRAYQSLKDPNRKLRYKNDNNRWGVAVKNISRFQTGAASHQLTAGLDYDHLKEDSVYVRNGVASPFAMHPAKSTDLGLYVQDEITMLDDRLTLTFGGRFDKYTRRVKGDREYSGQHFSPRVGLAYEVVDGLTLLANYSETFRGPLVNEYAIKGSMNPHYWYIPNPDLRPETAKEYEIGFSYQKSGLLAPSDSLRVKAMVFDGNIEDLISIKELGRDPIDGYGPLSPDYGNYQQFATYQNIGAAKRRGLEVAADYWSQNWHLEMSFEHLDIYDKKTSKKVAQGFADKLRLAAAYTHQPWGLTVGAEVNHWFKPDQNPESFVSRGKTYYNVREPFTQTNLLATWRPETAQLQGLEVVAGVNNVFDQKYINARSVETTSHVGRGRNVFVELKSTF